MSLPPTVMLSLFHSAVEGQQASPGRHLQLSAAMVLATRPAVKASNPFIARKTGLCPFSKTYLTIVVDRLYDLRCL